LYAQAREHPSGDAVAFSHQAEEEMFGADVGMVETLGFVLSQREDVSSPFSELVEAAGHLGLRRLLVSLMCSKESRNRRLESFIDALRTTIR
jgi:hypothetical protein